MRIAVIGGHGKVALLLAPLLVAAGDTVTAIHRNPDHAADVAATGARSLVADVERLDVSQLAALLAEHDAIVWSAGAGGGNPPRTYAVDRDAAIRSMDAASRAGVQRYVMVSYFGARTDHGVPQDSAFFPYAEAKAAADEHLRRSPLAWTILGPSRLTDGPPAGGLETADAGAVNGTVTRADVAAAIAATLRDPGTVGRTIRFNNGPTQIPDALRA
ncbi:NAD(P)H-binding protein [Dactylosporangium sucinum]|uniref:NAD-dependent dehydratase n=1 Tax=Dactylosporangium sucinum TaxID=1424081 RepID=A0A917U4H3_9ACTN|nr:NAD(P)H-binding protein [Dactylosporangium sucinum]GGM54773.1 NAD-dependent dehydratase [Dactylosporangium sucinum]